MNEPTVTLEELTSVRKRLQIEVPARAVQEELDRAYQLVGRQARLPGFRPGKAPRPVLERMFGAQVRREVLERLVEESFRRAIESHRLAVVGSPDIDAQEIMVGEALRYSATVEIRPVITLLETTGIEALRPAVSVGDQDVDRALAGMREGVAQLRPVEDRAVVEEGDVVNVDLESRLDGGEAVRREGVLLEAGGGSFPLALERQLLGQHCGATVLLEVPYPPDYPKSRRSSRRLCGAV